MLYLEVVITHVHQPKENSVHGRSLRRLAMYRFEDRTKLKFIIESLNKISDKKIDYREFCEPLHESLKMTTIQVDVDTRDKLAELKKHPRETYESVLNRLLDREDRKNVE